MRWSEGWSTEQTSREGLGEWNFSRLKQGCQEEEISDIYTNFCVVVEKVEPEVLSGGTSSRHKLQPEKFHLYLTSNFSMFGVFVHQDSCANS